MEPEKKTSARAKSFLSPLALLGILASSVAIIGFFKSRVKTPIRKTADSVDHRKDADNDTRNSAASSVNSAAPYSPAAKEHKIDTEKKPKRWYKRWKLYFLVTNVATLIAVTWYACISRDMWKEIRTSNQFVQRAFLTCNSVQADRYGQMDGKRRKEFWNYTMPCENNGATPATVVAQTFSGDSRANEPSEEEFLRLQPSIQQSAVGPKSTVYVGLEVIPEEDIFGRTLSEDILKERPQTKERITTLMFWGWISYRDVFPDTRLHVAEFCKQSVGFRINTNTPEHPYEWTWGECQHHNCADEYCADYNEIAKLLPNYHK